MANAIAAMMMMKLNSDRATISRRPKRSASRPQSGAKTAVIAGVTPSVTPVHAAMTPTSVTPIWLM